jgi:hypothetical protein
VKGFSFIKVFNLVHSFKIRTTSHQVIPNWQIFPIKSVLYSKTSDPPRLRTCAMISKCFILYYSCYIHINLPLESLYLLKILYWNPLGSCTDLSILRDRQREATLFYTMLFDYEGWVWKAIGEFWIFCTATFLLYFFILGEMPCTTSPTVFGENSWWYVAWTLKPPGDTTSLLIDFDIGQLIEHPPWGYWTLWRDVHCTVNSTSCYTLTVRY